jgi:hypothetical protein
MTNAKKPYTYAQAKWRIGTRVLMSRGGSFIFLPVYTLLFGPKVYRALSQGTFFSEPHRTDNILGSIIILFFLYYFIDSLVRFVILRQWYFRHYPADAAALDTLRNERVKVGEETATKLTPAEVLERYRADPDTITD